MSLQQYNSLMSMMLREKPALAKLREELEGRKRKLCFGCKEFGHLAQNCRKQKEEGKGTVVPQNKFEVLRSRIMQCGVEERAIRRIGVVEVECFKCGEKGHKYKECPLWMRKEKAAHVARPQKVQQKERPACPVRGEVQERKLRKVEKEEASVEELRKRAKEYYEKDIPKEVQLWDLGWCMREIVVSYLTCKCRKKGSYIEDSQGQGVIPF